jgi:hypothetical protein
MKTDKTRKVLKKKLTTGIVSGVKRSWPVADILEPGWDRGISLVFASLDRKTLTLAYYERV